VAAARWLGPRLTAIRLTFGVVALILLLRMVIR
jgi:hypothetical protein